ncbi:MAG: diphthine synthase [archaeon]
MLTLVGLGLDIAEITVKGVDAVKKADVVYLEEYTNIISEEQVSYLEKLTGRTFQRAVREELENRSSEIIGRAKNDSVVILVSGDPLAATTHLSLLEEAREAGVSAEVVSAPSIFTAVGKTGLQLYKFGRTVSLPSFGEFPSVVEYTKKNLSADLHTLILLDIGMAPKEAIRHLKAFFPEFVVVSRANRPDMKISWGEAGKLEEIDFGKAPHCLIVPAKLHFAEEAFLKWFRFE